MSRKSVGTFGLLGLVLVVGVLLDQSTKWYAAERLANAQLPDGHSIVLRVPASADGDTLRNYLGREFAANGEPTIDRIASRRVIGPDGERMSANDRVREGELLEVVHRRVVVVPGFIAFEYAENRGAAFNLLSATDSPYRTPLLVVVGILSLGAVLYAYSRIHRRRGFARFGLSLIAAGAVGNLIDRVRLGYVVDFILFHAGDTFRWPNFNLADAYLTVGLALVACELLSRYRIGEPTASDTSP